MTFYLLTTVFLKLSLALSRMRRGFLLGKSRETSRDTERKYDIACQCFLYLSLHLFADCPRRTQSQGRHLIIAMLRCLTMRGIRHQVQVDRMLHATLALQRRGLTADTDEANSSSDDDSLKSIDEMTNGVRVYF